MIKSKRVSPQSSVLLAIVEVKEPESLAATYGSKGEFVTPRRRMRRNEALMRCANLNAV